MVIKVKTKIVPLYFLIIITLALTTCGQNARATPPTTEVETTNGVQTSIPAASPTVTQPTATSTIEINNQPPVCTYPLKQTTTMESKPDKYTFAEPRVVFTDELQPDIVGWLPDSHTAIIMPKTLIDLGLNGYQETIE
jgi:hypothetical protein